MCRKSIGHSVPTFIGKNHHLPGFEPIISEFPAAEACALPPHWAADTASSEKKENKILSRATVVM